jgi:hypothetical protein
MHIYTHTHTQMNVPIKSLASLYTRGIGCIDVGEALSEKIYYI